MSLHLISHTLCPYVQRAAISLAEKEVRFERTYIDLANKPDWFLAVSPLGKTPVLLEGKVPIFESVAILEYLEETQPNPLHPRDALERARHRAWMEFGSTVLNDIAGFYSASDSSGFNAKIAVLREKFKRLEAELETGPYFAGDRFSLVDVVFGPVFRYFDVFEEIGAFGILTELPRVNIWRQALANRGSIKTAVGDDYPSLLRAFLCRRNAHLSTLMRTK
ncbi:MAG TPA: glutathione S-transferase family protein [Alphaproteobacteria bacterium]|nr:glutathione S-transferase family protein [Alphaproteobacteria bacterium]HAM47661.1 glutathione S-transferase family protein [Alphaproteobacteria bacterium]HBA44243.1 glutathione S-transferase family protein [Alphaproteobacteria bacterium]HBF97484.1 glutathione S-transferase family protein [Alphaproteobacteria bacterium]HCO89561.1 glutathione S-transferase family protein [Alphaproteobacteria bacterium]